MAWHIVPLFAVAVAHTFAVHKGARWDQRFMLIGCAIQGSEPGTGASSMATTKNQTVNVIAWVLQVLMASVFLTSGGAKLLGTPMMVATFEGIGVGQWFRYATGAIEVGSGIALLIPGLAAFATLLLIPTMICAAIAHVYVIGGSPVPALILLGVNIIILMLRIDQIDGALARLNGTK
jgi:putative oxidoreductase